MKKRNLLIAIIVICSLANTILSRIGMISPIAQFFLTVPFYVILLTFYRKTKYITIFAILTIVSLFGFYMNLSLVNYQGLVSPMMRFFGSLSFFGGLAAFIIGFLIVLQNRTYKFIEISLLSLTIVNYVFFSYFNFYFYGILITLFGPYEENLIAMYNVYYVIVIIIEIAVMTVQAININFLEKNKRYELRILLKDNKTTTERFTLD